MEISYKFCWYLYPLDVSFNHREIALVSLFDKEYSYLSDLCYGPIPKLKLILDDLNSNYLNSGDEYSWGYGHKSHFMLADFDQIKVVSLIEDKPDLLLSKQFVIDILTEYLNKVNGFNVEKFMMRLSILLEEIKKDRKKYESKLWGDKNYYLIPFDAGEYLLIFLTNEDFEHNVQMFQDQINIDKYLTP